MSPVAGPLLVNAQYLLVADFNQRNVYQLQLDSGEVRALPMIKCKPITLTFDPFINGIYVICDDTYSYHIHKKTFDGKIDAIIYIAPRSTFARDISVSVVSKLSSLEQCYTLNGINCTFFS